MYNIITFRLEWTGVDWTGLEWTGLDWTGGCSCMLSNNTTRPIWTNLDQLPAWYPSKIRTFWAYFEEKWPRNGWHVAKMICYSKVQLCWTSHTCIFWVLDNFYHHKNFMGSYYTLYTIVYNWFYVWNTAKIPVLAGLNKLQQIFCLSSLGWFGPVFCSPIWFFLVLP